jgi:hypothetical protein
MTREIASRDVYWVSKSIHRITRLNRRVLLFLAAMGPGIIMMIADNVDNGSVRQSVSTQRFELLVLMICLCQC